MIQKLQYFIQKLQHYFPCLKEVMQTLEIFGDVDRSSFYCSPRKYPLTGADPGFYLGGCTSKE